MSTRTIANTMSLSLRQQLENLQDEVACYGKANGLARKNYANYVKPNAKPKKNSARLTSLSFGHLF